MASRNERPRHVTEVMEGTFHGMESHGTEPFADAQISVFPLFVLDMPAYFPPSNAIAAIIIRDLV